MMADPPRGPILLTADWGQRGGQRARHGVHGRHRVGLGPEPRGLTHGLEGGAVILGVGCTGGIDPHYTPDLGTAGRGAGGNSMIGAVLVGGRLPHYSRDLGDWVRVCPVGLLGTSMVPGWHRYSRTPDPGD